MNTNHQKQILVINDEPDVLDQIKRWLSIEGYGVKSTLMGEVGVKLAESFHFDLILLDYNLKKEKEGVKTAQAFIPQLIRINPCTPIIVTSATVENISARKLGVARVIIIDRFFWKSLPFIVMEELKGRK